MNRYGKRCVLYPRVSTEMQVDGYSLEGQKNMLTRFADREEMIVVDTYEDAGKSGKSIEGRPAFQKMLRDIEDGLDIDYILVYKLSRFGRNAADILNSLELVQSYGVNLICIEEGIDSSQTSGKLLISVLSAVAEIERENIIEQTMNGRREKARQGGWNGGFAPYGYTLEDNKLMIEETEAVAIRKIFELYTSSEIGLGGIANQLNLQGIRKIPRQNGTLEDWTGHFIKLILDNPVYCGKIAYGRRTKEKVKGTKNDYQMKRNDDYILTEGQHKGIVSEEVWEKAHAKRLRTGVKQPSKIGRDRVHLLSGLLKCPVCGSPMYTNKHAWTNKDGTYKEIYYYVCSRNRMVRGKHCEYKAMLKKTDIEPMVIEAIREIVRNEEYAQAIKKRIGVQIDTKAVDKELEGYQAKLKEVDLNKTRLEREIDSLPADAKYRERKLHDMTLRLDSLYDVIVELEEKIEDARLRRDAIKQQAITLENIYKIMVNFDCVYNIINDEEKRNVVTALIKEIEIYRNDESEYPLKRIGLNFPVFKDGGEVTELLWDKGNTVETITVTTKKVVKESSSTISVSDSKQQDAEDALKAKIAELQRNLKEGEYIEVNGHHVDRHTEIETIITYFKTAINYKNMSDAEIVAMLKKQKDDADAEGKTYTGEGVKHNWDGSHSTTGSNPNYIGHLDLATDSDLHLEDGSTADAILLNTGDKKFKFEWNMSAEDLVNKDKKDNRAKFDDSISYDEGKMNDGSGSGELGHYEYERKYTGSWIAPDSNNYPHESAYYRLTGTIAYNSLEDGKEYGSKREAEQALAKWRAEHPDAEDYRPNVVALSKKDKWDREIIVYKAYTYESSLTAYGYMSKDSNTCVNIGYGKDEYGRPKWAGGFDLRISGLTQVTKTESSAHGKNYYDYYADITKYKTVEQTSRPLANRLLDVIPGTKTVPTETTNTDTGSGLFGSYDLDHREDHNYEKPFTGAGTAEYTTYRTWADTTADWDGEYEKLSGAFGFNYTTTKDAKVTEASKKTGVKTDSSVKYHYSYVERQELDPITETKTVTTPDDDDGDGGDKIIEEKDHDSPVLPGTPELPPVQDAKPDAPVLPADPALPAVQDAHALPQTGVNWLAAIGLALSGMTLMITGAFASLTGKNAKH